MTIQVFGITGTNGKTTASCMLKSILETAGIFCGQIGTIEYSIGDKAYIPINTTPGAEMLRDLFHQMSSRGINACVMEVSSHGLHQGRVRHIRFQYGGFTNLTRDHLDYHKTMENYYQAKKSLFYQCAEGAVINLDDSYGKRLFRELLQEKIPGLISCSLQQTDADFYGKIKQCAACGVTMELQHRGRILGELQIPMAGKHFASDALLASALAMASGIEFSDVAAGLRRLPQIPGRMELIGDPDDTLGIVDYAHTPDGLENLLQTVRAFAMGRVICVFGCGGFRDKEKRRMMGKIAGTLADYCIITNDNPRGEPAENIAEAIEEGVHPTGCGYSVIMDRRRAIQRAVFLASKWDVIVVAGKGHEKYQLIGEEKYPFDDSCVLKELLEKKYEKTYDRTVERRNKG